VIWLFFTFLPVSEEHDIAEIVRINKNENNFTGFENNFIFVVFMEIQFFFMVGRLSITEHKL